MIGLLRSNLQKLLQRYNSDVDYRRLLKTSFSSLIIRVFGMFLGFIVTFITARFYGADALGIVSICIAILSFASILGKWGMDSALVKYIAEQFSIQNLSAVKTIYLKAWKTILPITLTLMLVLFFSAPFLAEHLFHKTHLTGVLRLNSFFVLPLVMLLINSETIRSIGRVNAYSFFQTSAASLFVTVLLSLSIVFLEQRPTEYKFFPLYFQFIAITVAALISIIAWLKFSSWTKVHADKNLNTHLLKTSSPMFVTTLMQLLMSWAGTLIMAAYYSERDTGVYNAIVRISTFMNITILAVNSITQPRFASAYASKDLNSLKMIARDAGQLIFISTLPIFIVLFLFPHFILSIFGKDFQGYEFPLMLMLIGQLFVAFAGLPAQILNMSDRERTMRNNAIVSAIVNICACLILIPSYGITGAIIAQVAGMVAWNLLCILSVRKEFHFNSFFSFGK